jgi:hypothetical protein
MPATLNPTTYFKTTYANSATSGKYLKIKRDDKGELTHKSSVLLSGSTLAWKNPEAGKEPSKKMNHALIYAPAVRMAGTEADIRAFLKSVVRVVDTKETRVFGSDDITRILDNAYTYGNHDSSAKQTMYKASYENDTFKLTKVAGEGTFKGNYDKEMGKLTQAKDEASDLRKAKKENAIVLSDLKEVIALLAKKPEGAVASPKAPKSPAKKGEKKAAAVASPKKAKDKAYSEEKLRELKKTGEKYLKIDKCTAEGSGCNATAKPKTQPERNLVRLSNNSNHLLYYVGFSLDGDSRDGVLHFLKIYEGLNKTDAKKEVKKLVDAKKAAKDVASAKKQATSAAKPKNKKTAESPAKPTSAASSRPSSANPRRRFEDSDTEDED